MPNLEWSWPIIVVLEIEIVVLETEIVVLEGKINGERCNTSISFSSKKSNEAYQSQYF